MSFSDSLQHPPRPLLTLYRVLTAVGIRSYINNNITFSEVSRTLNKGLISVSLSRFAYQILRPQPMSCTTLTRNFHTNLTMAPTAENPVRRLSYSVTQHVHIFLRRGTSYSCIFPSRRARIPIILCFALQTAHFTTSLPIRPLPSQPWP